jgi:hypothetical protein
VWEEGLARLADRLQRALFGDELVEILGGDVLERLALTGRLDAFLSTNELGGAPLGGRLGGWLARARPLEGLDIVCYHKNWAYFEERFGLTCAEYVEARPGIPATPRHLSRLVQSMQSREYGILLAASYFDERTVRTVAERGDGCAVRVALYPGAAEGVDSYFDLVDHWIDSLLAALSARRC